MKTVIKYTGGKEKELPLIKKYLPKFSGRFIEPFVGGGSVFFAMKNKECYINDKSTELINFYRCIAKQDPKFIFWLQKECNEFQELGIFIKRNKTDALAVYKQAISIDDYLLKYKDFFNNFADNYNEIFLQEIRRNLKIRIKHSIKLDEQNQKMSNIDKINNIEAALKSAYYMFMRYLYNHPFKISLGRYAAVFYFVHEYCYSSMYRYNKNNEFNVPYGGISYNTKDFRKKIDYLLSDKVHKKISTAGIFCEDFENFLNALNLTQNDFIFIDPPYDSAFSTYANNEFNHEEQIRLYNHLKNTPAKIMIIIKYTEFIYSLYKNNFNIIGFDKKYMVNFKNRNNRDTKHLIITNY